MNFFSQSPPPSTHLPDRKAILAYFKQTWLLYDWLFSGINSKDAYFKNPDPLRHPLIFYWGHTAVFYINKLKLSGLIQKGIDPHLETIMAVGVDPEKAGDLEARDLWPSVETVTQYRLKAYDLICSVIKTKPIPERIDKNSPWWALMMGLEHDRIHFETSSVLIRQLPLNVVKRPRSWVYAPSDTFMDSASNAPEIEMIPVLHPGRQETPGKVFLGKQEDYPTFGWNNEYGYIEVPVKPFAVSKTMITNQQYLCFVKAGAYDLNQYWSKEGINWLNNNTVSHPKFWIPSGEKYRLRVMFDEIPMPLSWPVEVNCHEAEAFCNWKQGRLLSEGEFQAIVQKELAPLSETWSGDFNLNLKYGSPSPVGSIPAAISCDGVQDYLGNVWCWLSNDFYPLPGFEPHPLYSDFSEPFMDNKHAMLAGGSWASTGTSASKYYRLWFRRHFFQHAGFRLAKDLK